MATNLQTDSEPKARKPPNAGKGRPKGAINKATAEAQRAARALVDAPGYRAALKERLDSGKLAPAVETMLWHYAHGKPKETVEHQGGVDVLARIERVVIDGPDAQD